MHELSITKGIVELCLKEAKKHNVSVVNSINIKVGELTGFVPEYVEKYFSLLAKDTVVSNAIINIEIIPVSIDCQICGYNGALGKGKYTCPQCDGNKYSITGGREFYLDTMEVE